MTMSSRSIIWTLTQPQVVGPAANTRIRLLKGLRAEYSKKKDASIYLKNVGSALGAGDFFPEISPVPEKVLTEGASPQGVAFLNALENASVPPRRRRRNGSVVQQMVDPEFLSAAVSQWAKTAGEDDALVARADPILTELKERGLLSKDYRYRIDDRAEHPTVVVPKDFCDDGKNGLDLGLGPEMADVRKICYGIFAAPQLPETVLEATNPELWHERCPQFWLRSDVIAKFNGEDEDNLYEVGILVEEVNLPNYLRPFGPVALTYLRTTDRGSNWSKVSYKLVDQNVVKVNQGWYLVQRRSDCANAAIMVKALEFHRENDWLDSACETGLLDGARALLFGPKGPPDAPKYGVAAPAAVQDEGAPLATAIGGFLDECRRGWDLLGRGGIEEIRQGVGHFESNPMRFGWVDNIFGLIDHSTSFMSKVASDWADVVQQDLPAALAEADASADVHANAVGDRAIVPAGIVSAGWNTVLGTYRVGNDLSRAMLQVLGPGAGRTNSMLIEALDRLQRSGRLAEALDEFGITDIPTASQSLINKASRVGTMTEFEADLDGLLRTFGPRRRDPDAQKRSQFAREVWEMGQQSRRRRAGR